MNIVAEYQAEIAELNRKIRNIQDKCSHPEEAVDKKHEADTGNWCRQDDRHWTDFHCKLCDKHWTENGSK